MDLTIALLFPVLTVTGLLCFFAYYLFAVTPRKGTLEWIARMEEQADRRLSFHIPRHPMARRDALPLILLTAVYAATAFWNLGDTKAPQSFCALEDGQSVLFSAQESFPLGEVDYYTGLWTGTYTLEISDDGKTWISVELEQDHAHLFYWRQAELPQDGPVDARWFRLTAHCDSDRMELGELAVYSTSGDLVLLEPQDAGQCAGLFDEQDLVPDEPHWTNSAYFDEIYHARTAYENTRNIYPYEQSHPPLGKLIISLGIQMFGMTPFGWRFMGTLFGVLMVPLLYVFLKNMFGRTAVAFCGTALFTFDFMHLTQTRIATIDSYGVFFILAMYFFLYRWLTLAPGTPFRKGALPLFLSGLMFGLGASSKWIVIYGAVGMALLYLINVVLQYRSWPQENIYPRFGPWLIKTLLFSVLCFVLIPALIYTLSYWPYAIARGGVDTLPAVLGEIFSWPFTQLPLVLRGERELFLSYSQNVVDIMLNNQHFMLTYHVGVHTPHPYSSRWYQWLLDIRPILYYMVNEDAAGFTTRFASFNNPIVSWGGLAALVVTAVQTVRRHCGRGLFIVVGYLSQFLPWVFIGRITFAYHYFPSALFLCFALAYVFHDLAQSGRPGWRKAVYGLTGSAVGLYALFYPALVGIRVPTWFMRSFIRWFPSWPF